MSIKYNNINFCLTGDTEENWKSKNPIIHKNEPVLIRNNNNELIKIVFGDGENNIQTLLENEKASLHFVENAGHKVIHSFSLGPQEVDDIIKRCVKQGEPLIACFEDGSEIEQSVVCSHTYYNDDSNPSIPTLVISYVTFVNSGHQLRLTRHAYEKRKNEKNETVIDHSSKVFRISMELFSSSSIETIPKKEEI